MKIITNFYTPSYKSIKSEQKFERESNLTKSNSNEIK